MGVVAAIRVVLLLVSALACTGASRGGEAPRKIILVGGARSEAPGRHEYGQGIRRLQQLLQAITDSDPSRRLQVEAYPDGWPTSPGAFDGAASIVWYFDGQQAHPLLDPAARAVFETQMRRGVGLVALHQSSTVPPGNDLGLPRWLGAVREGMFDRTTEAPELAPASAHPVARGVGRFSYRDEFYPTLRIANGPRLTPILRPTLHVQYRDGARRVKDQPEPATVAWAWDRPGGGRSFGFTGAHYLHALDQRESQILLLNAITWTAGLDVPPGGVRFDAGALRDVATVPSEVETIAKPTAGRVAVATFHHDRERSGWRAGERLLRKDLIAGDSFGLAWESPHFDSVDGQPPRLYASPLYVEEVGISAGQHRGASFAVVFAASNNGFVYAVNAANAGDVAAGRILWSTRLGAPCRLQPAPLDGVPSGVLSTPVIDLARKRMYVTHCDPEKRWQAYALDITSGAILPGWPVPLDEATFNRVNANAGPTPVAPKRRFDFRVQRGALNLSPDGSLLYVVFGETETGWLVAVDTQVPRVRSAFAAVAMPHRGSGGIWGAGGPAVDESGDVFVVTGTGFEGGTAQAGDWTQSLLRLAGPRGAGFELRGTYSPFNHCLSAARDIDLGSGGALLFPRAPDARADAPRLLAFGGKQGNAYLLDRDRLPGKLDRRPPCSDDPGSDGSLLAPGKQPQFGGRGPLNVFGPYSEKDASLDLARSRSVPAAFIDRRGVRYLFVTGNTKVSEGSPTSVAPSLARLEIATPRRGTPYLRIDAVQAVLVFGNPGSPVVTSDGAEQAIVWVLDENAPRTASLQGPGSPQPVLYALDAESLALLWRSRPGELFTSGKYNEPAFGNGSVFVGTDRIQAFAPGGRAASAAVVAARRDAPAPTPRTSRVATGQATTPAAADAASIFQARCAACHDHPQGNIPPRKVLATRSRERIIEALTNGVMKVHARGLDAAQIEEMAAYLK